MMQDRELKMSRTDMDRRRFESLMGQTRKRAYSMAYQLTRNSVDAEDLMQETFVKAWRGYDSYADGRPFLNWLLRIMQRAYLDSRRRENPIRKADSLNSMISPNEGDVQEIPVVDEKADVAAEIERRSFSEAVHTALHQLPDVYRQAIIQCDLEQLSYAEIADLNNTTIGTVRSRIHRGRKLLRDIIVRDGLLVMED
jgi:RNA polymerase sigma-70 factor, ECF subfamily